MGQLLSRLRRSRRRVQQEQQGATNSQVDPMSPPTEIRNVAATSTTTTSWKVTLNPPSLQVLRNNEGIYQKVMLKGVCYSPCPLNGSNACGPNIGDWFWDSFSGVTGWEALWQRDLPNIRAPSSTSICANTIRVYCMIPTQLNNDGVFPNDSHVFTHTSFLDICWNDDVNPLYVLVGFPMPQVMFWKEEYDKQMKENPKIIESWENLFVNTIKQMGAHPAVLGFVIQNELDSNIVTWPNTDNSNLDSVEFWWKQVEHFAQIAKTNAPDKLVGMAVHDVGAIIPDLAHEYMATCESIDYWGINTYQPQSFDSIFNGTPNHPIGYAKLTSPAKKPVILTEYGFPSTSRPLASDPTGICSDTNTQQKVANVLNTMLPKAFEEPLCFGVYIFEFCDEWWNQGGSPNIYTWYGGQPAAGFPNGYWDQEGFGIFAIQRGGDLKPSDTIWNATANRPATPIDVHTPRQPVLEAIRNAYTTN